MWLFSAIKDNVSSLFEWAKEAVQGGGKFLWDIVTWGKQLINYWISEFITNRDDERGIKDFDKFQWYEKQLQDPTLDDNDRAQLYQNMANEWIVDMNKYQNWNSNQPQPEISEDDKAIDSFRKGLTDSIMPNFKAGDKRQRDVLTEWVNELTKDYDILYRNTMDTYKDTKDEKILTKWNELGPKYQQSLQTAAKTFANSINAGKSYQDAYADLVKTNKDLAEGIVDIQNQMTDTILGAGTDKWMWRAQEWFSKGNLVKGIFGTVMWGLGLIEQGLQWLVSEPLEELKQGTWYYDTLEELSNLWVYKEWTSSWAKWLWNIKGAAFELFDALPSLTPAVASLLVGNKASSVAKLDELLSIWSKLKKTNFVGRLGSELIQDFVIYDTAAQQAMGRPMTDEDLALNAFINIPVDWMIALLNRPAKEMLKEARSYALPGTPALPSPEDVLRWTPEGTPALPMYSNEYVNALKNMNSPQDLWYARFAETNGNFEKKVPLPQGLKDKDLIASQEFDTIKSKINNWEDWLMERKAADEITKQNKFKKYTQTATDPSKAIEDYVTNLQKVNTQLHDMTKLDQYPGAVSFSAKMQYSPVIDLYRKGLITKEDIFKSIDAANADDVSKSFIKRVMFGEPMEATALPKNFRGDATNIFDKMFVDNVVKKTENLKPGNLAWKYIYKWNNIFMDMFTGEQIKANDIVSRITEAKPHHPLQWKSVNDIPNVDAKIKTRLSLPFTNGEKVKWIGTVHDVTDIFANFSMVKKQFGMAASTPGEMKIAKAIFNEAGLALTKLDNGAIKITWTQNALIQLSNTIDSIKNKSLDFTVVTPQEMWVIKLVYANDYLKSYTQFVEANGWKDMPWKSFFEKLYDNKGALKFDNINKGEASQELQKAVSESRYETERIASTIQTADKIINVYKQTAKQAPINDVKQVFMDIMWHYNKEQIASLWEVFIDVMLWATRLDNLKDKWQYAIFLSRIFWWIFADPDSLKALSLMDQKTQRSIYRSVIGRLITQDEQASRVFLWGVVKTLRNSTGADNVAVQKFIERIERTIASPEVKEGLQLKDPSALIQRVLDMDKLIQVNKGLAAMRTIDSQFFKLNAKELNTLPAKFYKGMNTLADLSDDDILYLAERSIYQSFNNIKYYNDEVAKEYSQVLRNKLQELKVQFPDTKIRINNEWLSVAFGEWVSLNISPLTNLQAISMLAYKDNYIQYIMQHEIEHIKLNAQSLVDWAHSAREYVKSLDSLHTKIKDADGINRNLNDILYYIVSNSWQSWAVDYKNILESIKKDFSDRGFLNTKDLLNNLWIQLQNVRGKTLPEVQVMITNVKNSFANWTRSIEELLVEQAALKEIWLNVSDQLNMLDEGFLKEKLYQTADIIDKFEQLALSTFKSNKPLSIGDFKSSMNYKIQPKEQEAMWKLNAQTMTAEDKQFLEKELLKARTPKVPKTTANIVDADPIIYSNTSFVNKFFKDANDKIIAGQTDSLLSKRVELGKQIPRVEEIWMNAVLEWMRKISDKSNTIYPHFVDTIQWLYKWDRISTIAVKDVIVDSKMLEDWARAKDIIWDIELDMFVTNRIYGNILNKYWLYNDSTIKIINKKAEDRLDLLFINNLKSEQWARQYLEKVLDALNEKWYFEQWANIKQNLSKVKSSTLQEAGQALNDFLRDRYVYNMVEESWDQDLFTKKFAWIFKKIYKEWEFTFPVSKGEDAITQNEFKDLLGTEFSLRSFEEDFTEILTTIDDTFHTERQAMGLDYNPMFLSNDAPSLWKYPDAELKNPYSLAMITKAAEQDAEVTRLLNDTNLSKNVRSDLYNFIKQKNTYLTNEVLVSMWPEEAVRRYGNKMSSTFEFSKKTKNGKIYTTSLVFDSTHTPSPKKVLAEVMNQLQWNPIGDNMCTISIWGKSDLIQKSSFRVSPLGTYIKKTMSITSTDKDEIFKELYTKFYPMSPGSLHKFTKEDGTIFKVLRMINDWNLKSVWLNAYSDVESILKSANARLTDKWFSDTVVAYLPRFTRKSDITEPVEYITKDIKGNDIIQIRNEVEYTWIEMPKQFVYDDVSLEEVRHNLPYDGGDETGHIIPADDFVEANLYVKAVDDNGKVKYYSLNWKNVEEIWIKEAPVAPAAKEIPEWKIDIEVDSLSKTIDDFIWC